MLQAFRGDGTDDNPPRGKCRADGVRFWYTTMEITMKIHVIALSVMFVCLTSLAMPTNQEIEEVAPVIEELTRDEVNAMKAGKKTRGQLAEAMLGYLGEAESEAAKLLLIRHAFQQYMISGDTGKAVETYLLLDANVEDVPKGLFATWCSPYAVQLAKGDKAGDLAILFEQAFATGDSESATALYKQLQPALRKLYASKSGGSRLSAVVSRFASMERRKAEAAKLRTALGQTPSDIALREKYGVCLVAMGDWKAALKEFAQTGGKLAEIAVWENNRAEGGSPELTSADVAEFWWEKSSSAKDPDIAAALRNHAAGWYRVAVDAGELTGLKKSLAEKRIAEVAQSGVIASVGAGVNADKPILIPMRAGVEMELMPCPAGTFTMGYPDGGDAFAPHKVTFSRPFWMAKYLVTREQWNVLMPSKPMSEIAKALGGDKVGVSSVSRGDIEEFCKEMTKHYRTFLPPNYVFRLPTEAVWEYACRANAGPGDPYGKPKGLVKEEGDPIAIYNLHKTAILKQARVEFDEKKSWALPGVSVGRKKPNQWGLYDMIGNLEEIIYDCLPSKLPDGRPQQSGAQVVGMRYEDATDPLSWTTGDDLPMTLARGGNNAGAGWGSGKKVIRWNQRVECVGFRIVVGPDLAKERKLKLPEQ